MKFKERIKKACRVKNLIIFCLIFLGLVGVASLYSAAGSDWYPWARNHLIRGGWSDVPLIQQEDGQFTVDYSADVQTKKVGTAFTNPSYEGALVEEGRGRGKSGKANLVKEAVARVVQNPAYIKPVSDTIKSNPEFVEALENYKTITTQNVRFNTI